MNKQINAIAKVTGYHPATGLHLVEGEPYTIDEAAFADDVFSLKNKNPELKIAVPAGGTE